MLMCRVMLVVHQLPLERSEEALHRRVVIAVAGAAHAGGDFLTLQQGLTVAAGVLHPAIGVMHQSSLGPAPPQRPLQTSR
jgi:hypothetical protein